MMDGLVRGFWLHFLNEGMKLHIQNCEPCRTMNPCLVGNQFIASLTVLMQQAAETSQ